MYWEQLIEYASISDIGFRRQMNQDAYAVQICPDRQTWDQFGHLFVVCDGMGGHAVGELASKIAIDTIPLAFYKSREDKVEDALKKSIELANANINNRGTQNHDFQRMGTTCSALVLSAEGAIVGHVGDSRVYRVRGDVIEQLTFDHSLQWELLKQGKMSPEEIFLKEPRNVITRSLGPMPEARVDVEGPHGISPGDVYVLCSDGLTGHVSDAEIGMLTRNLPPADASRLLVHLANLRGGSDNITVIIVRVGALPEGLDPAPPVVESDAEDTGGIGWWWLLSCWAVAALYVLSVCLAILKNLESGLIWFAVAVLATTTSVLVWFRQQRKRIKREQSIRPGSSGPYRIASAKLMPQFVSHLAAVEAELQRTAQEEEWDIDWPRHQLPSRNAQSYMAHHRLDDALLELSRAVDVLMSGVQLYRKHRQHQARWGKPPRPLPRTSDDKGG
jgi:PPM family protein phosphatase